MLVLSQELHALDALGRSQVLVVPPLRAMVDLGGVNMLHALTLQLEPQLVRGTGHRLILSTGAARAPVQLPLDRAGARNSQRLTIDFRREPAIMYGIRSYSLATG